MTTINVVDAPCGYGKTSWAIQYMNSMPNETHKFIYVTPFLEEVERVLSAVTNRQFFDPMARDGSTKLDDLHNILREGKDICTTHALFQMANHQTRELLSVNKYTLILDEVINVIEQIRLRKDDLKLLINANAVSIVKRENGLNYVNWNECLESDTKYNDIKNMAFTGNLMYGDKSALIWNFPCEIFLLFENVFILTYLFGGQIQRAYYDLHRVKYIYLSVKVVESIYELVPYDKRVVYDKELLRERIIIHDGNLNDIGEKRNSFSKAWFQKPSNKDSITKLRNNARNYLMNICKATGDEVMWTTIKGDKVKGDKGKIMIKVTPKGYANSFVPMTSRATNQYKDRTYLAYLVNRYMNPIVKDFFEQNNVVINEETWALSELVQWLWRSGIRDDKKISVYIPSKRMRELFVKFLNSEVYEEAPENAITNQPPSDWHL
ncbi:hypothetical protein [Sporosarcina sp. FA9]|uniref:hypothetical protein n=1 Tax=Sporosarcina sp. FA9 TaxID=3413030 RepID=UPI003F657D76